MTDTEKGEGPHRSSWLMEARKRRWSSRSRASRVDAASRSASCARARLRETVSAIT